MNNISKIVKEYEPQLEELTCKLKKHFEDNGYISNDDLEYIALYTILEKTYYYL